EKKVSVIIPFYSGVDWLSEAVQSVLDQTYDNFEIIVVNDGSGEDVTSFLNQYGDKIIYRYKENGGAATARNLAMRIATGDYLAFLDSDDIWLPTKTEKQIAFMEEIGALWSHTGFYYWTPETDKLERIDNSCDYGSIYEKTFISIKIATPSVVIHQKVIQEYPEIDFPVELRKGQDTAFFRSLSNYYKIALIEEPLVKVRMRGSKSNTLAIVRFNLRAYSYPAIKSDPTVPKDVKRIRYIYYVYGKIFGKTSNKFKEFIAKCFWTLPYTMERLYVRRFVRKNKQDELFIKRDPNIVKV